MTYDKITGDGRLWSAHYPEDKKNAIETVFDLRLYAIKLEPGIYIITGGAIKLTRTMQEREHTLKELTKMEQVRSDLIAQNVVDSDSFVDYLREMA